MYFQIIVTLLLILCSVSMFITGIGKLMPPAFKIIPLLAALVYWAVIAIHHFSGKTGIAGVLLLIIFYFLLFLTILTTVMVWMGDIGDREKHIPAITIGEGPADKTVYIVYHSGITPVLTNIINGFAGQMSLSGYKTILYCANNDLTLDLKGAAAVGFASPIYGGKIRPPVVNFIRKNNLKGVRSFIILTSGGPDDRGEIAAAAGEIEKQGGSIIGSAKFGGMEKPGAVNSRIKKTALDIQNKLK